MNAINSLITRRFVTPTATNSLAIDPTTGQTCTDPRGPVLGGPYGPPVDPKDDGKPQGLWRGPDDRKKFLEDGGGLLWADMIGRSSITYGYRRGKGVFPT